MTLNPGSIVQRLRARLCYWLGVTYHYWGNARGNELAYEKAVLWYTCALEANPNLAQARLDRGILYWRELDKPRQAIHQLSYLLTRGLKRDAARFNRAVAYQQLRKYERALKDFRAYLEIGQHPQRREYAEKMLAEFGDSTEKGD